MNNLVPFAKPTFYSPGQNALNLSGRKPVNTPSGVKFYTPPTTRNALNPNNLQPIGGNNLQPKRGVNALMDLYNQDLSGTYGQSPGDTPGTGGDPNQGAGVQQDPNNLSIAENLSLQGELDAVGKGLGSLPSIVGDLAGLYSAGISKLSKEAVNDSLEAMGVNFGDSGIGPGTGIGAGDAAAAAENAQMGMTPGEAAAAALGLGVQHGNLGAAAGPAATGHGTDGTFSFDPQMSDQQIADQNKEMQNNMHGTLEGADVGAAPGASGPAQGTSSNFSGTGHQQDNSTGGTGDGTSTVICTELHRQGLMEKRIYEADSRFGMQVDPIVKQGYHAWAKPWVRVMQRSKLATRLTWLVARPWAYHMAFKMKAVEEDNATGRLLMNIGLPACKAIGRVSRTLQRLSKSVRHRLPWTASL